MSHVEILQDKQQSTLWITVFIFAFLALLVDGMSLMFLPYSLTALNAEFGLTDTQAGSLGSVSLIGMAIGGVIGGIAADRYGRVRVLALTITAFSLGTALLAITQNFMQFFLLRGFSSMGLGAVYVVANILMAEYVPTKYRTTVLGTVQAGWSVGYLAATLLARWIVPDYGWRWLFLTALPPIIMCLCMRRIVPEPPAWLAMVKKRTQEERSGTTGKPSGMSAFRILWRNPQARFVFIAWTATTTFLQFGYYGVSNWMPAYLERELHMNLQSLTGYMVGTYTSMILGKVAAGYCADKFGRRLIFVTGGILTALFLPLIVLYHTPGNITYLLIFFGFLYGIPYGVNATYMTESFETEVRGTAMGTAYNIGRVGAAVAPLCIGWVAESHSIGLGFVIMGVAYFLAGLLPALFIGEKQYNPAGS